LPGLSRAGLFYAYLYPPSIVQGEGRDLASFDGKWLFEQVEYFTLETDTFPFEVEHLLDEGTDSL
jgi:hypothetical protein